MDSAEAPTQTERTGEPAPAPRAGAGLRVLALALALVVAFGAAVAVLASAEVTGWTPCVEVNRNPEAFLTTTECFDGSQKRQILSLAFAWPGALLLVAGCLLAIAFAIRGRGARAAIIATVGGAVLFGLSMLVSSVG